jgi:hypothetical protein
VAAAAATMDSAVGDANSAANASSLTPAPQRSFPAAGSLRIRRKTGSTSVRGMSAPASTCVNRPTVARVAGAAATESSRSPPALRSRRGC